MLYFVRSNVAFLGAGCPLISHPLQQIDKQLYLSIQNRVIQEVNGTIY